MRETALFSTPLLHAPRIEFIALKLRDAYSLEWSVFGNQQPRPAMMIFINNTSWPQPLERVVVSSRLSINGFHNRTKKQEARAILLRNFISILTITDEISKLNPKQSREHNICKRIHKCRRIAY